MITQIEKLPSNMVGFRASGNVTEHDFSEIVMPTVKELIKTTDKLNYMLVLDTSLKNFTAGAWFDDAMMGIKYLSKWKRAAIVSDIDAIRTFTEIFSILMPEEFKGFEHKEEQKATDWVSGKSEA